VDAVVFPKIDSRDHATRTCTPHDSSSRAYWSTTGIDSGSFSPRSSADSTISGYTVTIAANTVNAPSVWYNSRCQIGVWNTRMAARVPTTLETRAVIHTHDQKAPEDVPGPKTPAVQELHTTAKMRVMTGKTSTVSGGRAA